MARKYDYDSLERQYVKGDMSIRELCRQNEIPTWSTVSAKAKRDHWDDKRADYRQRAQKAEEAVVIDRRVDRVQKALDDAIAAANRAVFAFVDSLEDRWVEDPVSGDRHLIPGQLINGQDFVKIVEKLQVLSGQPTERTAHLGLNVEAGASDLSLEMLRDIAAMARGQGADVAPTGSSPLPRSSRTVTVN